MMLYSALTPLFVFFLKKNWVCLLEIEVMSANDFLVLFSPSS
jgi:hypothetical protein